METIEDTDIIRDDLRPFYDSEIPAAMKRLAASPTLSEVVNYAFPGADIEDVRQRLLKIETSHQFQMMFVKQLLENIVRGTMKAFTTGGLEKLDLSRGHLYISNHRDIVLDGALLQLLLLQGGLPTSEITFGSNLVSSGFVEDFGRSNKMYKILRGGSARDLVRNSHILSKHLHNVVGQGDGIWISQRDGRTKDGNDRTDQGILKMFSMEGGENPADALKELNIQPVAISYEYESCDALKARELYISRREPYVKAPGEDMKSILTGVKQYKGEVHMEVCPALRPEEIEALDGDNTNEMLRNVAALIDARITEAYKLYNTNLIAYDIREGSAAFAERYTESEKSEFMEYIGRKLTEVNPDEAMDPEELAEIMLDIYANPVRNKLEAGLEI